MSTQQCISRVVHPKLLRDPWMKRLLKELEMLSAKQEPLWACPRLGSEYLSTDIHQLFRYENFDQDSVLVGYRGVAWDAMAPALTFVTKMLTTAEAQGWLHRVLQSEPNVHPSSGKLYLHPVQFSQRRAEAELAFLLSMLSNRVTFYWQPSLIPFSGGIDANGAFCASFRHLASGYNPGNEHLYYTPGKAHDERWHAHIGLSAKWLYYLISPEVRAHQTKNAYMRMQFALSCTILHELGHAVCAWRHSDHMEPEPYIFLGDPECEVGHSFQYWAFGGDLSSDYRLDKRGVQTLCLLTSDQKTAKIPMKSILRWFYRNSWEHIDDFLVRHRFELSVGGTLFKSIRPSYKVDTSGSRVYFAEDIWVFEPVSPFRLLQNLERCS